MPTSEEYRARYRSLAGTLSSKGSILDPTTVGADGNFIQQATKAVVDDIAFSLKSIPHIIPLLTEGFGDENTPEEEKRMRRRALADAALTIGTAGMGKLATTILKPVFGLPMLRHLMGSQLRAAVTTGAVSNMAYTAIDDPDAGAMGVLGSGLIGGAFGGAISKTMNLFHKLGKSRKVPDSVGEVVEQATDPLPERVEDWFPEGVGGGPRPPGAPGRRLDPFDMPRERPLTMQDFMDDYIGQAVFDETTPLGQEMRAVAQDSRPGIKPIRGKKRSQILGLLHAELRNHINMKGSGAQTKELKHAFVSELLGKDVNTFTTMPTDELMALVNRLQIKRGAAPSFEVITPASVPSPPTDLLPRAVVVSPWGKRGPKSVVTLPDEAASALWQSTTPEGELYRSLVQVLAGRNNKTKFVAPSFDDAVGQMDEILIREAQENAKRGTRASTGPRTRAESRAAREAAEDAVGTAPVPPTRKGKGPTPPMPEGIVGPDVMFAREAHIGGIHWKVGDDAVVGNTVGKLEGFAEDAEGKLLAIVAGKKFQAKFLAKPSITTEAAEALGKRPKKAGKKAQKVLSEQEVSGRLRNVARSPRFANLTLGGEEGKRGEALIAALKKANLEKDLGHIERAAAEMAFPEPAMRQSPDVYFAGKAEELASRTAFQKQIRNILRSGYTAPKPEAGAGKAPKVKDPLGQTQTRGPRTAAAGQVRIGPHGRMERRAKSILKTMAPETEDQQWNAILKAAYESGNMNLYSGYIRMMERGQTPAKHARTRLNRALKRMGREPVPEAATRGPAPPSVPTQVRSGKFAPEKPEAIRGLQPGQPVGYVDVKGMTRRANVVKVEPDGKVVIERGTPQGIQQLRVDPRDIRVLRGASEAGPTQVGRGEAAPLANPPALDKADQPPPTPPAAATTSGRNPKRMVAFRVRNIKTGRTQELFSPEWTTHAQGVVPRGHELVETGFMEVLPGGGKKFVSGDKAQARMEADIAKAEGKANTGGGPSREAAAEDFNRMMDEAAGKPPVRTVKMGEVGGVSKEFKGKK